MSGTFFAIQLACDIPLGDPRRQVLNAAVHGLLQARTPEVVRTAWQRAARAMHSCIDDARLGTWDLIRGRGGHDYSEWVEQLDAIAHWQEQDFGSAGRFLLITAVMLVPGDSNSDRMFGEACDLPEEQWHDATTYAALITALSQVNAANLVSSALYIAPHPDHAGLSLGTLTDQGFEYLAEVRHAASSSADR